MRQTSDALRVLERVLGALRPEFEGRRIICGILSGVLLATAASSAVVALENRLLHRRVRVTFTDARRNEQDFEGEAIADHERDAYFFDWRNELRSDASWLLAHELRVAAVNHPVEFAPASFLDRHPCDRMYALAFSRVGNWDGRAFFLDPEPREDVQALVGGLDRMLRESLPLAAAVCDLASTRSRIAAEERARLGRDLHDGVVQALAIADIQLEMLKRNPYASAHGLGAELGRIQDSLRAEIAGLRTLIVHRRTGDVLPGELAGAIDDLAKRFERDTGILVRWITDTNLTTLQLPPPIGGEILRILGEALVNVRRHSGASQVAITFTCEDDSLRLTIEDDGRGFSESYAPLVINERVRSIGGQMRVASVTQGARLELALPRRGPWTTGGSYA